VCHASPSPCHYEWIKRVSDDCLKYRVNFTIDALGSHFVKDGRMYHLDSQELQGKQAFRSGLSHFFRKPKSRIIIMHWPMPKPVQQ